MRKFFLLLIIFSVALGGCGSVDWFPEQGVSQFSFDPDTVTDVAPGSTQTSNTITVQTRNESETISVSGGEYSINGGEYTSGPGEVTDGDQVTVQHEASDVAGETVTTTLRIGDKSATFSSVTGTPIAFEEPLRLEVEPGTEQLSSTIPVTISGSSARISVTGGQYRIERDGQVGPWTSNSDTVNRGDRVTVRHTAADGVNETTVVTTLTIGSQEAIFATSTTTVATVTVDVETPGNVPELIVELRSLVSGPHSIEIVEADKLGVISLERDGEYSTGPIQATLAVGQVIYFQETAFPTTDEPDTTEIEISDAEGVVVQRIFVNVSSQ